MIMNKNTNGFLPNKQNKYSIGKYTVGTASLLIGATLVFGAHAEDAKAAEEATVDSHQTPDAQPEASEAPVTVDKATTPVETNEAPAPVTAEKVEAPVAEGETTEAETTEAVAPKTEEKSAEAAEVTPTVEEKAETTPALDQKEADKAPTTEEKASEPVVEKAEAEPAVAPGKAATSSENAPTTAAPKMDQPEVGTLDGVPTTVDNINQLASDEEKAEALADFYAKGTGLSTEAAAEKVKSMNIDFSTADVQKVLADMLVAFANEQDKNKVAATPVSLRSARPMMRMAVAAEQPSGTLITKDNGIKNIQTTMTDVDKDSVDGDGTIYPQNYGYVKIHTSFDVDNAVKSGDMFQIKYNNNLQISDYFEDRVTPPAIKNAGGDVIATGTYDVDSRTMTYKFTDYVDRNNDVKVSLDLVAYVERDVVKENGQYDFDVTVAGETTSTKLNVKYLDPRVNKQLNLNSFYNEYDNVTGEYSQIAYINPKRQNLIQPKIEIKGYGGEKNTAPGSSSAVVSQKDKLEVYEVPENVTLSASYKPDKSSLTLLKKDVDYTLEYGNDMVTIKPTNQNSNKHYMIYIEGQQDMTSDKPLVQSVTLYGETSEAGKRYDSYLYSENYIETTNSSAAGQGEPTYKLGNRVWEDMNDNDIQDNADKGIANVTVTLKNADTQEVIGTQVTDANGYYLFDKVKNGNYIVEFTDPTTNATGKKYVPVKENVGTDKEVDSDTQTVRVTIQDKDDLSIDRGFEVAPEPKYSLGDKVWEDTNKDGIQDTTESGIANVKVTLTKADGTKVETTTDKDGNYKFTDLPNGKYTVTFETPDGYEPTQANAGNNDEVDSDGQTVEVVIDNKDDMTIDSGFHKPEVVPPMEDAKFNLGDKVWEDLNKDGIQNSNEPGIGGVTVTLTKEDGTTVTAKTDDQGNYKFTDLPNGKYTVTFETPDGYEPTKANVGDDALDSDGKTVEVVINNKDDMTIDSGFHKPEEVEPPKVEATFNLGDKVWEDLNKDGIQNSNEPGISGVTVTLTKEDGSTVTAKTDENGNYKFTELPNGKYTVTFETPEGYEPTKEKVGDYALDSDGQSVVVVIDNKDDMTIDSGFHKPEEVEPPKVEATFNLGDKVWEDLNKDGIQNSNEPGIGGVTVTLTKEDGTTVTAKTDENGNYKFTELPNGKYTVTFETPEGYEPTKEKVGDYALDSDGQSVVVVIDNKDDMTIDSGFHKPEEVEPPKVEATFNLGDKVWEDLNKDGIQNSNEPGIGGVTVTLTKEDGTTVTAKTDENGNYKFTELPNGEYTVTFETPKGYEATKTNVGDDALDSDGQTVKVIINNKDDMTIDSGFHKPTPEEPMKPTPEKPEQPNNPTPEVPEQPGQPENPTPEKPEQPSNPTPEVPEQPGQPENPTPEKPEQPSNPTPEMPEQPGNPSPSMPNQPMNMGAHGEMSHDKAPKHEAKALPETGETSTNQAPLFGGLLAALGTLFVVGRRKKQKDQ
ncbi:SdrD B-like domain-containing protein [Staphylococcus delphini]|uniref:SdrD B-like domain-containing protein n=1 Tax=Staphylococcus delphini TaxID=53344 RepID=UPI0021D17FF7|nr:SdrD B-like domain-containing protein [Staphylococcus delphini]UXS57832.1 carboxypeptidase regulatory-like domain-containing protein [Staphylococcus delphini]